MNHIQLLTVRERRMLKRIEMLKNIEHPPDQKEDLAQERYLTEWNRKHGKRTGKDEQETEKEVIQADSRVQSAEENETGGGVRIRHNRI